MATPHPPGTQSSPTGPTTVASAPPAPGADNYGIPTFELPPHLRQMAPVDQSLLMGNVQAEVGGEIDASVAPLQSLISRYQTQEGRAVEDLNTLFGENIQPFVNQSTAQLAAQYNRSVESEKQIQVAAQQRLNQLHQQRAADAQALAQQIGGPVPLDMFLNPVDVENSLFAAEGANSLMYSGMLRDVGIAEAEAFSGRVFPLLRAEKTQEVKNYFRDQIKELESQIAAIKGTKKGMINERFRDRLVEERTFRLEKLKADRDAFLNTAATNLEASRIRAQMHATDQQAKTAAEQLEATKEEAEAARAAAAAEAEADRKFRADQAKKGRTFTASESAKNRRLEAKKLLQAKNKETYERTVTENLTALTGSAFYGGAPADIYRIIRDDLTGELKNFRETVQAAGGMNPATGKPWTSKEQVINYIFSKVNVSKNNKRWYNFVKGKVDLMWGPHAQKYFAGTKKPPPPGPTAPAGSMAEGVLHSRGGPSPNATPGSSRPGTSVYWDPATDPVVGGNTVTGERYTRSGKVISYAGVVIQGKKAPKKGPGVYYSK